MQGIRWRDGNSSEAIAAILHPNEGYREKLKKRGITPKDYERENKLRLKQMQRQNREQRLREEAARREAFKLTRFKGVRPRVHTHEVSGEQSAQSRHAFLRRNTHGTSQPAAAVVAETPASRSQLQTPVLPPAFSRPKPAPTRPPRKEPVPSLDELEARSRELVAKMSLKDRTDFVNANAWNVIRKSPAKATAANGDGGVAATDAPLVEPKAAPLAAAAASNRSFGRIPKYLLARKEQWAREEDERRRNAPDPDCPPGMVLLDDDERQRTLRVLRQSLDEARVQMNHLPLRIETPSQIRRKDALERKLQEIEDAITVFDRAKVYVAAPLEPTGGGGGTSSHVAQDSPTKRVDASRRHHHMRSGAAA